MQIPDYNFSKEGKRWVSCFDRLGFGKYSVEQSLVSTFFETRQWLEDARQAGEDYANVELAWLSDTVIFYSDDDSRTSFQAVSEASRSFFDTVLDSQIPLRGALAFGEFYADKTHSLFLGKALADAYKYGEKFDWLGFVLHPSALKRMAELRQPVSELTYKRWDAEFKNRETDTVEQESVVAYVVGPGSIMPVAGGNPYLANLEEMAGRLDSQSLKRKYHNTIRFLKQFDTPSALNG